MLAQRATADLNCHSRFEIFETLVHEAAHALEAVRIGKMGHEKPFVDAYEDIEALLKRYSFSHMLKPWLRLSGVRMQSSYV